MLSKKPFLLLLGLAIAGTTVFAADQTTATTTQPSTATPVVPKQQDTVAKSASEQNKPTVGSRQSGSEQLFGQSATPSGVKKPATNPNGPGHKANRPTVGGRQSGSEQLFGQSATPPASKQTYHNPHIVKGNSNNPNVGGRQSGSEQLFGQSAKAVGNVGNDSSAK